MTVVDIEARPEARQPIRRARYYLAQGMVTAIDMERTRQTLFFSEHSSYVLRLRPSGLDEWVPYHIYMSTRLMFILRSSRWITRRESFFGYGVAAP